MKIIELIKIFLKAQLVKLSVQLFNLMYRNPITGMKDIIENAVNNRTIGALMAFLDQKRIMHCAFCPNTETLHKHEAGYVCDRHQKMAEEQMAKRAAEAAKTIIKPGTGDGIPVKLGVA